MNLYGFLACALLFSGSIGYGFYERGNAESWELKYNQRVSLEQTAAAQAKLDAAAQEKKDLDALNSRSATAISQAQSRAEQAQVNLVEYQKKIKKASGEKDDGHRCAGVEIPSDLLPGHQ